MTRTPEAATAPLVKTVRVGVEPERAFTLFTARMGEWWPLATHSVGRADAVAVVVEDGVGGRIVETTRSGERHVWGTITGWDPPTAVRFTWHPGQDAGEATRVTVRFRQVAGGTDVELTHDGWEARAGGAQARGSYDSGWDLVLGRLSGHTG